MRVSVKLEGVGALKARLLGQQKQVAFAASRAINQVAHKVEAATYAQMDKAFHSPTPYTKRSMAVKRSTKRDLVAIVGIRGSAPGVGYASPGKGTQWEKALGHHFTAGARHWKKFEAALMRSGVLPAGMAAVPPRSDSWAVTLDAHGNIPPSMIRMLLSYFKAAEQTLGYKANMSDRRRKKLHGVGRTASGYKTINGAVYFAVRFRSGATRHLHPGIWAKRGIHGADIAPVLLFVRRPAYTRRIDLEKIAVGVVSKEFRPTFERELASALASAR